MRKRRTVSSRHLFLSLVVLVCSITLVGLQAIATVKTERIYQGYLGQEFEGRYSYHLEHGEWVFTLLDRNRGVMVRLLFYCGFIEDSIATTSPNQNHTLDRSQLNLQYGVKQYDHYCAEPSEVPLKAGQWTYLRGTFIVPSQLDGRFEGDLYVMQILG